MWNVHYLKLPYCHSLMSICIFCLTITSTAYRQQGGLRPSQLEPNANLSEQFNALTYTSDVAPDDIHAALLDKGWLEYKDFAPELNLRVYHPTLWVIGINGPVAVGRLTDWYKGPAIDKQSKKTIVFYFTRRTQ